MTLQGRSSVAFFGVVLTVPILALGAVTDGGLFATVGVVGMLVTYCFFVVRRSRSRTVAASVADAVLWSVAAFMLMQLLPLPAPVLEALSSKAGLVWRGADVAAGWADKWHPVSLDPPATAFAACTALVVATFFHVATREAESAVGRIRLVYAIATAVLAFDLVAIAHPLFDVDRLYGYLVPDHLLVPLQIRPPLLNSNHAAAVACVGPPLLAGIALEAEATAARVLALLGGAVSGAVTMLTLSRGGIAVLAGETVVLIAYALLRTGVVGRRLSGVVVGTIAVAGSVGAAAYVAFDPIILEARNLDVSKIEIARRALLVVTDFPLVGAGAGAFTSVFSRYEGPLGGTTRYTHTENWPSQLVVDLGYPVAIVCVCALAYALVRSIRGAWGRPITVGALVALGGLLVHDLFDFAMSYAAVALVAAALFAVVVTSELGTRPQRVGGRHALLLSVIALAVGPIVLARHWHHDVDDDARALATRFSEGRLEGAWPQIQAAMERHPAEPYFPMIAGVRLLRFPEAAPFFLRAVQLGPSRAQTHFWLARWFVGAGHRSQAWTEYREALALSAAFVWPVLEDMLAADAPLEDIEAVAVSENTLDSAAVALARNGREADAQNLDDYIIASFPVAADARARQIARAIARGRTEDARQMARALLQIAPQYVNGYLLASSLEEQPAAKEAVLVAGLDHVADDLTLLTQLVRLRGERLGLDVIAADLDRLREALSKQGKTYLLYALKADVEMRNGHPAAALQYYLDAAGSSPNGEASLEIAAKLAETMGQWRVAINCWRALGDAHPADPRFRVALERVERELAASAPTVGPEEGISRDDAGIAPP